MKHILFILIFLFTVLESNAQEFPYNKEILDTLNMIKEGSSLSKDFASMYYKSIEISNNQLSSLSSSAKEFIIRFESSFAACFFKQHFNKQNQLPVNEVWKTFFSDTTYNKLQYQFIGMNAHINGDIWVALVNTHKVDSILKYKIQLLDFQKSFDLLFDSIYKLTFDYSKVRLLNTISLGLTKPYGKKMIYRWRKRQILLAIAYYTNENKFNRLYNRIKRKKAYYDKFALKWLK